MKKFHGILCPLIAAALLFAACSSSGDDDDSPPEISIDGVDSLMKIGSDYPMNGNYTLQGNIDLGSNWMPIGAESKLPFTGTFDGNGHTITLNGFDSAADAIQSSFYAYSEEEKNGYTSSFAALGIFRYADGASIKNLTVTVDIGTDGIPQEVAETGDDDEGGTWVGSVVGLARNTVLENITATGNLKIAKAKDPDPGIERARLDVGGIAGSIVRTGGGKAGIYDSNSSVNVRGEKKSEGVSVQAGGIVARNTGGRIENCLSSETVTVIADYSSDNEAGGIAGGSGHNGSLIINCSSSSLVSVTSTGVAKGGGLVGECEIGGISGSHATGNVNAFSSGSAEAGGLVGRIEIDTSGTVFSLSDCYATGLVSATNGNAGGIVGCNKAKDGGAINITQCYYNTANGISSSGGSPGLISGYNDNGGGTGTITIGPECVSGSTGSVSP
jgi:hypothetical protein